MIDFNFKAGDRLAINGKTYTTRDTAEGMALDLSGGGKILLHGVEPQNLWAAFFV